MKKFALVLVTVLLVLSDTIVQLGPDPFCTISLNYR